MHQNRLFCNFSKSSEKTANLQKMYAEILNLDRSVVTHVGKNEKWNGRNFFGSHLEGQSVVNPPVNFGRDFEVEDHLKIDYFSCRLQPSIGTIAAALRSKDVI